MVKYNRVLSRGFSCTAFFVKCSSWRRCHWKSFIISYIHNSGKFSFRSGLKESMKLTCFSLYPLLFLNMTNLKQVLKLSELNWFPCVSFHFSLYCTLWLSFCHFVSIIALILLSTELHCLNVYKCSFNMYLFPPSHI